MSPASKREWVVLASEHPWPSDKMAISGEYKENNGGPWRRPQQSRGGSRYSSLARRGPLLATAGSGMKKSETQGQTRGSSGEETRSDEMLRFR